MNEENCFNCHEQFSKCQCGEPEAYSNDKPHCPYCGARNGDEDDPDPRYYDNGDFHNECDECGKEYLVDVYISYSYTCTRKEKQK